jgi:general secretion pathway protein B
MSYILDALRRADSERERGTVPNLHAKPAPVGLADADDDGERRRPQPLLWAVIGLSLLLAAVLVWQFMGSAPEPVAPAAVATAPVQPAPVMPVPSPPPPQPTPAPVAAVPAPPPPQPVPAVPRKAPTKAVAKPQVPPPAASAVEERPVMGFNELPENIRRELPQLVIGGAMYSRTPASRMLILNGQVFHEGDKVAGDLVLEQIRLKSAVLAYKGYRYGINY